MELGIWSRPSCSLDLNSIKHAWDALERRIPFRLAPSITLLQLRIGLTEYGTDF